MRYLYISRIGLSILLQQNTVCGPILGIYNNDKKENKMRKYFPIYEEAVSHIRLCNCSTLNFFIYEENLIFFFISEIVDRQINAVIGTEAAQFPEKKYMNGIFVAVVVPRGRSRSRSGRSSLRLPRERRGHYPPILAHLPL